MSDITTIEEVDAGEYTVRVAQTDDGQAWEAVVVSEDGASSPNPTGMMVMLSNRTPDADDSDDAPVGTPVTAPHRWVAIGFAIEAYEWETVNEEPVDVPDGYERFSADADGFEAAVDTDIIDTIEMNATAFSTGWTPDGDGDE